MENPSVRRLLVLPAILAGAVLLGGALWFGTARAHELFAPAGSGSSSYINPSPDPSYWTPERMRDATPMPMPAAPKPWWQFWN